MKIRLDFVSNSSSSSFVFYIPSYSKSFIEMQEELTKAMSENNCKEGSWFTYTEHPFTNEEAPDEDGEWKQYEICSNDYDDMDKFDAAYSIAKKVFKDFKFKFDEY